MSSTRDFELASLTEKDRRDLPFVAQHADMIGYSFVQTEADVAALLEELAKLVPSQRTPPALVLKIETKKAVKNLQDPGGKTDEVRKRRETQQSTAN